MDLGLAGRVALVTGASGGIGAAIARTLAGEGARVAVAYNTDQDAAELLASDIRGRGGEALVVRHDLSDPSTMREAVEAVSRTWGGLDVLAASAWVRPEWPSQQGPVIDPSPLAVWRQQLRVNLEGTAQSIDAVLPCMKAGGWGRIVLMSSGAAEAGQAGLEAYAAAKAALHALARSLASGLGRAGILTNVVMPGFIATERNRRLVPAPVLDQWAAQTPTGRLATEDEVAGVVAFLASAANGSVNGAAVKVSGGR
jgi:3-oxoacyl-[acyl-carrier protein] reductase